MNETYLETQSVSIPPAPKKGLGMVNIVAILLGLFSLALLCVVAGLGYWAYTLNQDLTTARADIVTLQGEKTTLTTEKNKLTTDLNTTRSDLDATKTQLDATKTQLESTKTELETTKADLESARSDMAALQANVDKALKYLNVFDGFCGDTFAETEVKIKATGDTGLLSSYRAWEKSRTNADFYSFFDDLVGTVISILK